MASGRDTCDRGLMLPRTGGIEPMTRLPEFADIPVMNIRDAPAHDTSGYGTPYTSARRGPASVLSTGRSQGRVGSPTMCWTR